MFSCWATAVFFFLALLVRSGVGNSESLLGLEMRVGVSEGSFCCCMVRMRSMALVWLVYIYLVSSLEVFLQLRLFYCPITIINKQSIIPITSPYTFTAPPSPRWASCPRSPPKNPSGSPSSSPSDLSPRICSGGSTATEPCRPQPRCSESQLLKSITACPRSW